MFNIYLLFHSLESFDELSTQIIKELRQLLAISSKETSALNDEMVILQIILINIFSIENCKG